MRNKIAMLLSKIANKLVKNYMYVECDGWGMTWSTSHPEKGYTLELHITDPRYHEGIIARERFTKKNFENLANDILKAVNGEESV